MDLAKIQQCTLIIRKREKDVQEQSKSVRCELEQLKVQLLSAMQSKDISFIPIGDKLFAVRKVKINRPQITSELITVALRIHARNHSQQLTEEFIQSFWNTVVECQQKMCLGKEVVEFQETVPVQSLY